MATLIYTEFILATQEKRWQKWAQTPLCASARFASSDR